MSKLGIWGLTHDDQHGNTVLVHGSKFIRFITDATVVSNNNPSALPDCLQPDFVSTSIGKVISVLFNGNACVGKNSGEAPAQIAISEEYEAQAARS